MPLKRVTDSADPLWDFWLSVYYQSFPDNERMTVQYLMSLLGKTGDEAVFVTVSEWGENPAGRPFAQNGSAPARRPFAQNGSAPAGIALYEIRPEQDLVNLWYLAVAPEARGTGAGTALFGEIVKAATESGAKLLVWEVELPDPHDPLPVQRINWYKRLGGRRLQGIRYHVSVDKLLPPVPMGLMVLFLDGQDEDAGTVFARLKAFYGDNLEPSGDLRLE